ncbi:MAG: hypothetical protein CLLPBCKN_006606 [Chroococcidiopsis cubana SAG 39.79]|nr:hypothetical protein [Chroococcidiopsis cubana SAG 39.79]MDZ4877171.1 hypothetical protein [Chroococcidiopsis cubana SAG 39.79]
MLSLLNLFDLLFAHSQSRLTHLPSNIKAVERPPHELGNRYDKPIYRHHLLPLAKDGELQSPLRISRFCLAFKTVLNSFPLHGSSMIWCLSYIPHCPDLGLGDLDFVLVLLLPTASCAVFLSWQCRWSNWRF